MIRLLCRLKISMIRPRSVSPEFYLRVIYIFRRLTIERFVFFVPIFFRSYDETNIGGADNSGKSHGFVYRHAASLVTGSCRPPPGWPGTDVMITFFCDFWQFSAKKLAFFLKTNAMIKFWKKISFVWSQKRQIFADFFAKVFKKYDIGPRSQSYDFWINNYSASVVGT
jgi:hypothetical protein